jgi:hypothetical protein
MMKEIEAEVMRKYPTTREERRGCETEKRRMNELRKLYKNRLIEQRISQEKCDTAAEV